MILTSEESKTPKILGISAWKTKFHLRLADKNQGSSLINPNHYQVISFEPARQINSLYQTQLAFLQDINELIKNDLIYVKFQ